ncbi:MAG: DUF5103 domain-containing protein [Muribaculaceae bacterium]|nr:DUF5103 domain-containing protein [Muribaculaceae bacterium]
MRLRYFHLLIIMLLTVFFPAKGEIAEEDTRTQVADSRFKSLQVKLDGNDYFPPIITLNSDSKIRISFDELSDERSYLRYSIIHCNADWTPSNLVESEYLEGFNYADIEEYKFSIGTLCHYVHYSFSIPNDKIQFRVSGNYLVKIYADDEPDVTLLQARFYVCENAVSVGTSVTSRTDIDYNREHQQVSFIVDTKEYSIRNMYSDLKAYVSQNSRIDNEVIIERPLMVSGKRITYDHDKRLIFEAGNEFRRIETVAQHGISMGVESMEYHHPYYHARLFTDRMRTEDNYIYDKTQMGRFTIRSSEANDSDNGSEYIITHFTLDTGGKINSGKIYINGEFTNNMFTPSSLMKYDPSTGLYYTDMLLKQGAYNYQYLYVPDGSRRGYYSIEGNKYQTVNEYLVRIYHRDPASRYDRFIGFGITFSGK